MLALSLTLTLILSLRPKPKSKPKPKPKPKPDLEGEQRATHGQQVGNVVQHVPTERWVRPRLCWKRQS